jgi:hypothetical protein
LQAGLFGQITNVRKDNYEFKGKHHQAYIFQILISEEMIRKDKRKQDWLVRIPLTFFCLHQALISIEQLISFSPEQLVTQ